MRHMSLDNWALGCPCSGNIQFQRRMSSFVKERTASMRRDPGLQPQSQAWFCHNSLLSLQYVAYRSHAVRRRVIDFVGGRSDTDFSTDLPPSYFVLYFETFTRFMGVIYLIFYAFPSLRFPDVETNSDLQCPVPAVCRILGSNVRDLTRNLSDLIALRLSMIIGCETVCMCFLYWPIIIIVSCIHLFVPMVA